MSVAGFKFWEELNANPQVYQKWYDAMMIGINAFHADENKHENWLKRLSEVWDLRECDATAFKQWRDAMMIGTNAFHADPNKHAAWLAALSTVWRDRKANPEEYQKWWDEFMDATWRNNDWRINHALTWFKVRKVPRLGFDLCLAGWEHRGFFCCWTSAFFSAM
jgi:hypothetical protein